jgi:hypothetical protein
VSSVTTDRLSSRSQPSRRSATTSCLFIPREHDPSARLERDHQQRGSGSGKVGQAGGGASAPRVGWTVDASEVVKEVVARLEAEPIQRRDVAFDPLHLDARFGCPPLSAGERLVDRVDRGHPPAAAWPGRRRRGPSRSPRRARDRAPVPPSSRPHDSATSLRSQGAHPTEYRDSNVAGPARARWSGRSRPVLGCDRGADSRMRYGSRCGSGSRFTAAGDEGWLRLAAVAHPLALPVGASALVSSWRDLTPSLR